ncbi:MAG TPA: HD domain-containing phosphohydrolase [Solirubrobacteraceae bacterium]|nr:HD domain-containing phosphohydrolase [Solirubrobacteraceae bacterium]
MRHPARPRPASRRRTIDFSILALSAAIFIGGYLNHHGLSNAVDADEIVPVALLALRFGKRGGLVGAIVAVALTGAWEIAHRDAAVTVLGYASRGVAFALAGIVLGAFIDQRRRLEAELLRYFDESPDLLVTIDPLGYFTRVNPAWEATLGFTAAELRARPSLDFVHPDDRPGTLAEAARVIGGSTRDLVNFRNRYLTADGGYRWLEWNAHAAGRDRLIHAAARDITTQVAAEEMLAGNAVTLEARVAERTRELDEARAETLQRLARAGEYRDYETFQHTERVGQTSAEIAAVLGLGEEQVELIREAAQLHDIGKLAISDTILLKPGPLSSEERKTMQGHAEAGSRLLSGSSSPVLNMAATIAMSHHERWDGRGYPERLSGEAIPLEARIVAVADVFDALTHDRPYKSAWPVDQALAEIDLMAGSEFDPQVVSAFAQTPTARAAAAKSARPLRFDSEAQALPSTI